ncbi:thiol reductant ABC exporter subunit CydC [Marinobacter halophilus]|uniref:Thiol reductant ABC exporter subunit CydC n=1 Tax=Marinobacter halophilus TaxID=1323740 RepID=A0A2T1K839_9GAMM|nr:thiol reductant ABC exporter subunit CydC [Marinobacter halophilus]PSF06324.1 thiol reductant ABC exporter subunit CydC [Marinobacter halophilus]GGC71599.1 thiol reductant ABC exporter subunit CydC [Marinobacter halophilus]
MHELRPWLRLIFRRRGRLTIGALLLLATLLSGISLLALSGWFLTETALVGLLLAAGTQAYINLYVPGGGIRFFAVSRTVSRYLERLYNHNTVLQLLTDIRVALFNQMATASQRDRGEKSGAQWLSRLTADVDALDTLYLRVIAPTVLAAVVSLILVVAAWLFFTGTLAVFILAVLTLAIYVASRRVFAHTQSLSGQLSDQQEALRGDVIEHLEGYAELTAAGRTGKHAGRLMRQARSVSRIQARVDSQAGWHQAASHLLVNLTVVITLWSGAALFQQGQLNGPVLVLLPIALLGLIEVYATLPDAFAKLGATLSAARRLNDEVTPGSQQAGQKPVDQQLKDGMALIARDVSVGHPGHAPVLSHFTLSIVLGERLGIVGASGAGKSTLADTIAGLIDLKAGTITALPCAYLTQKTVIFEDTVKANLLLGNPTATDGDVWRVLELVDLAERFVREPDGLNTWLGSAGNRLSGGEARRLVLARVLLNPAALVILDEPFTGVDADTRERLSPRINQWLEGRAVISLGHGPEALLPSGHTLHLN